jgi:hypothetical protein
MPAFQVQNPSDVSPLLVFNDPDITLLWNTLRPSLHCSQGMSLSCITTSIPMWPLRPGHAVCQNIPGHPPHCLDLPLCDICIGPSHDLTEAQGLYIWVTQRWQHQGSAAAFQWVLCGVNPWLMCHSEPLWIILHSLYSFAQANPQMCLIWISLIKLLTLYSSVFAICTTCFNTLKLCILPTQCVCVSHMVLTINTDCFPKQH